MKISIFTPDHRGVEALEPCRASVQEAARIVQNNYPGLEVEWLIGWNGDASSALKPTKELPAGGVGVDAFGEVIIREVHMPKALDGKVGALKLGLCQMATGDYLLELDSDDELLPACLDVLVAHICEAEAADVTYDFIYSDALRVNDDDSDYIFAANCGWTKGEYFQHKYHPTPPMNAANLYTILHAPDHFRCWRREFYNLVGGHNEALKICDDLDLLQRTYLNSTKLCHIHLPLYKYNVKSDGSNTWLQNVKEIQQVSANLGNKQLIPLLEAEAKRNNKPIVELGGKAGTPNRHTMAFSGSDQDCDLRYGIPLEDNSVTAVFMQDVLEHFDTCRGVDCRHELGSCVVGIMQEVHRVLVPGGMLIANTPSTNGDGAWGDPSHKSGWNMWSVNYYTEKNQASFLGKEHGEPTCKFVRHRAYEWFPSQWHEDNNLKYLHFTLGALKPGVYGASTLR